MPDLNVLPTWLTRVRACIARLSARVGKRLDENAEKHSGEWGARMEYRHRYTNPDEAKRYRTPPAEKR
jgi:hypothetical protein